MRVKPSKLPEQKRSRTRDSEHMQRIRALPCLACGKTGCHAAHVNYSDAKHGTVNAMGRKADDCLTVPLCPDCHLDGPMAQHKGSERRFWDRLGIDPIAVALDLYQHSHDEVECLKICLRARGEIL